MSDEIDGIDSGILLLDNKTVPQLMTQLYELNLPQLIKAEHFGTTSPPWS